MNKTEVNHNCGIDLLRIVAMLMIVAHHFSLHSGVSVVDGSCGDVAMQIMALGGKTGVNIFVLITGYYSSGKIRFEKVGSLIGSATFYSLFLTLAAVLTGSIGFSKKLLLKSLFPLIFGNTYWFVVTYLELYILIPLLSEAIRELDLDVFKKYLILFTVLLCVLPTVAGKFIQTNDFGCNALVWFVYLFCLGAYLKKSDAAARFGEYIYIYILRFLCKLQHA